MTSRLIAAPMDLRDRLFPIPSVEGLYCKVDHLVEAVGIDAPGTRMGTRLIEAFDAAKSAKQMLGFPRPEAIALKLIAAGDELELLMTNDDVKKARHPADRTIAVERGHRRFAKFGLKSYGAAVAPAADLHCRATLSIARGDTEPRVWLLSGNSGRGPSWQLVIALT